MSGNNAHQIAQYKQRRAERYVIALGTESQLNGTDESIQI